jgi:hypothetical protein
MGITGPARAHGGRKGGEGPSDAPRGEAKGGGSGGWQGAQPVLGGRWQGIELSG